MASSCRLALTHASHCGGKGKRECSQLLSNNNARLYLCSSATAIGRNLVTLKRTSRQQALNRFRLCSAAGGNFPEEPSGPSTNDVANSEDRSSSVPRKPERLQPVQRPQRPAPKQLGVGKLLEDAAAFVTPREKGDIRDVVLCSLSFAILVYISQQLVTAYAYALYSTRGF